MNYPYECENCINAREVSRRRQARAIIKGGSLAPNLRGFVVFTNVLHITKVIIIIVIQITITKFIK